MITTPAPGAVRVCFDRDMECGNNPRAWCSTCPKRAPGADLATDELPRAEQVLRRLLAYRVAGALLYANDGELQDNTAQPFIDFKRDSVDAIETKLGDRTRATLAAVPASEPVAKQFHDQSSIAIVMSNVMFNSAQKRGHTLTEADCELFDRLRKRCDASAPDAAPPAPVSGMPTEWRIDNKLSNGDVFSVYLKEQPTEAMLIEGATVTPLGPVNAVSGMPDLASDTQMVLAEVRQARNNWPPFNSAHEGYAVLLEEVDELKAHVWTNQKRRDLPAMRKEAMQVAAMALRFMGECCDETTGRK